MGTRSMGMLLADITRLGPKELATLLGKLIAIRLDHIAEASTYHGQPAARPGEKMMEMSEECSRHYLERQEIFTCRNCVHWMRDKRVPAEELLPESAEMPGLAGDLSPCAIFAREDPELENEHLSLILTPGGANCLGLDCGFEPTRQYLDEWARLISEVEASARDYEETLEDAKRFVRRNEASGRII